MIFFWYSVTATAHDLGNHPLLLIGESVTFSPNNQYLKMVQHEFTVSNDIDNFTRVWPIYLWYLVTRTISSCSTAIRLSNDKGIRNEVQIPLTRGNTAPLYFFTTLNGFFRNFFSSFCFNCSTYKVIKIMQLDQGWPYDEIIHTVKSNSKQSFLTAQLIPSPFGVHPL